MEDIKDLEAIEKRLREATLDPLTAIQVAGELAVKYLGQAHEAEDNLRVDVAKEKVKLKDANLQMPTSEVEMRVEATDLFRKYLRAKHFRERIEEFIRTAKIHARAAGNF